MKKKFTFSLQNHELLLNNKPPYDEIKKELRQKKMLLYKTCILH